MVRVLYPSLIFLLFTANVYCADNSTPIYISFVVHNEEPGDNGNDYLNNPDFYLSNRFALREFALMLKSRGVVMNFQSDWNYLLAVAAYDVGDVVNDTNGKNIVRWMVEDLGFEVDPHAHETVYNYADVAYLITKLGVTPSGNVGGFIYYVPGTYKGWEKHIDGLYGVQFPSYYWRADNLWGASTQDHSVYDDTSFGVWQPKRGLGFYEHDPSQRLLYIGSGCDRIYWMDELIAAKDNGTLNLRGFYTSAIFVPQRLLDYQYVDTASEYISSIEQYVNSGKAVWMSLTQTANIWRKDFASIPSQAVCNKIPDGMVLDNSTVPCPVSSCTSMYQQ